jgi:DNA repair exonuclease SbcCD ATPase subunit
MIQEGQDKTNSNKTALLNLILMQGEALDVEKAKLATAGERLSAIVLPEEQLTSLRQAYEKLDGQVTWLSERIANSREQYENLQPVDENRLSEIIRRMEVLRGEMSRAATTEDVAAIKDELAALQEETSTMSDLCKAQSDQLRMMVGDAENWSQEIRTISKGITELNKSLDEAEILAEHLAAELKASQTELLEKVKSSENVLASLENRLSECHTSVDFYEQNYKLVETRFDEVKKVCNEILELMKNPVLTEDQLKDFEARYELIFYGYRQIVKNVSSEAIDSFNTSEQSVLNDIQHLRSKLQQLREKIIAAKLMSDLLDVNDAVQVTRADVEKTYAQTSEFMLTFEDFVKSYPFDEIQSNLSIVQGQFETLKADMETVITSIGTVVINGKVVTSCRDASGRPASPRQKGLVFIQFADGTVKKVYNK